MSSDVLIVGGGVIGLSIARELHRKGGGRITIVDRGILGGEASWAAAGMLAPNIETDSDADFHRFGTESLGLYPEFAAELLGRTGIDVELDRSGTLCLAFSEREDLELEETYSRQQSRNSEVELLSGEDVRHLEPSISAAVNSALFYPNDWQVENRKLIQALRKFAERSGIRIIENAEVSELLTEGRHVVGARTSGGALRADTTVIATGAWTSLIKIGDAFLPVAVKPIRGQMISFQTSPGRLRRVVYSTGGYLVPRADGRILVGATVEDVGFEKAVTEDGIGSLVLAALEILPEVIAPLHVAESWSGLRPYAVDELPVMGEIPGYENLLVATAHYRNGILLAPKTAELIANKIIDEMDSKYFELYGPARFASAANATTNS